MTQRTCSIDGCGKTHVARGWCDTHYGRWRRWGDPQREAILLPTHCVVPDCNRPQYSRGWCGAHHHRWRTQGDPCLPPKIGLGKACSIESCERLSTARGWCSKHYTRWMRTGSLEASVRTTDGVCSVVGCGHPIRCIRLCASHYKKKLYADRKAVLSPLVVVCVTCGKKFQPQMITAKYCSTRCRDVLKAQEARLARQAARVTVICLWCGVSIVHLRADAKYCSDICSNRVDYRDNRDRITEYNRRWVQENRERARATSRAYALRNQIRLRDNQRRYAARHKDHLREYLREYNKTWGPKNRYRAVVSSQNRRKWIATNPGSVGISPRDWQRALNRSGGYCFYCGTKSSKTLHMDHVIPLVRGGRHAIGNVVPACGSCNYKKNARFVIEWRMHHLMLELDKECV